MPDIAINPAASGDYSAGRIIGKTTPTYLVSLEDGKKTKYFIATKYDENGNYAKCVGFYSNIAEDNIISSYEEIVKTTEKTSFTEMLFPWSRIVSVRSLVYRHK